MNAAVMPNDLMDAALNYAARGFPVFPCDPATKRPYTGNGFKDATTDAAAVRSWWTAHPDAMIAFPTGQAIGAWVLDVDDPAAFEAACPFELPATRRCVTGKGYHLYFGFDPQQEVRNAQIKMVDGERRWPFPNLPGAEVRGNGGYVIVPPSLHPNGKRYSWAPEGPPAQPPAELLRIVRKESPAQPVVPSVISYVDHSAAAGDTPYGLAGLDGECEAIRRAANGAQESVLNSAALKVGGLVAGGALTAATAKRELIAAGMAMASYNSADKWTLEAVSAKVERGMVAGAGRPKAPAERMRFGPRPANDDRANFDPETGEVFTADAGGASHPITGDPIPIDLWARYNAPSLPRGVMPKVIEDLAFRQADIMGVDPAGLAMAALTVCAAAITDDICVQVKRHDPTWRESARLWTGMIGPPSTKKTPIMKVAMRPIARIDGTLMRAYMGAKEEYDALPSKEQKTATKPKLVRHVVSDATTESLQEVLRHSTGGMISEQDELSGWFGAMDKYSPGKGQQADRAFWLKAFNGGRYTLDRIARGSTQLPNLSICLLGGIQPEVIRKITSESVDDGLIQRLLPVILAPASQGKDVPAGGAVDDYDRLVERLILMRPPAHGGIPALGETERPTPLRFSDTAREIREGLEAEHLDLVRALEGTSGKLAAHFGKYDGIFARLCVLWHCIDHSDQLMPPVEISGDTAGRVASFMDKFTKPSAIAFYAGMLGLSDGHEQLVALASYIVSEGLQEVNARAVQRSTRSLRSFSSDEARQLCERLEGFGWLDPIDPPSRSSTPRWRVIPAVHEIFAEKGRQDAERRQSAREALRSALGG
jgi:hypothetical protein